MCCQSASDLSAIDIFLYHTCAPKHALPHFDCYSYIFRTLLLLSLSARCLFIRQTICWSCVFFLRMPFPWHAASHGGALPIIWCAQEAQREPLPATQRWSLCVFARGRIMGGAGESLLFSSPHYSFGKLISSFLWPTIIYNPEDFMAHFRIRFFIRSSGSALAGVFVLCNRHCAFVQRAV